MILIVVSVTDQFDVAGFHVRIEYSWSPSDVGLNKEEPLMVSFLQFHLRRGRLEPIIPKVSTPYGEESLGGLRKALEEKRATEEETQEVLVTVRKVLARLSRTRVSLETTPNFWPK